jgi:hypothetical protein
MDSMDTDGDNFLSMEELKGGFPKATNADFRTIDLNKDNRVSSVELLAPTAECRVGKKQLCDRFQLVESRPIGAAFILSAASGVRPSRPRNDR